MKKKKSFYMKANRTFTTWRRWAWLFTLIVAIGGIWVPKLGLLVFPVVGALLVMSFFKGRYWCGHFCPHGSLYDHLLLKYTRNEKIPAMFRSKLLITAVFGWFGFNIVRKLMVAFQHLGTDQFLDKLGFTFTSAYLLVLIVSVPLGLFIAPRAWCQICPMGTMQKLSYRLGKLMGATKKADVKVTISDKEACIKCGKCARVCPMQLSPYQGFSEKNQFDHIDCIRCTVCVKNCPLKLLSMKED